MTMSPIVSVDWLIEHNNDPDIVVADVRPVAAYAQSHLPGAISIDLAAVRLTSSSPVAVESWFQKLQALIQDAGIAPNQTVVFYEDISGTMAAYGVWMLDAAGLANGAMLDGGIQAWYRAGQPLSDDPTSLAPSTPLITPNLDVVGTLAGLVEEIGAESGQRVDARADHEHAAGAMPAATNVDWTRHLDGATGTFLPMPELAALYADLDPTKPTTTYCAAGFRAANSYVVLKALGFSQPRSYAPSWSEWGTHPQTPKV
jgi:thiosulfate/3-mercaptopyruvate sulfurtransferase